MSGGAIFGRISARGGREREIVMDRAEIEGENGRRKDRRSLKQGETETGEGERGDSTENDGYRCRSTEVNEASDGRSSSIDGRKCV